MASTQKVSKATTQAKTAPKAKKAAANTAQFDALESRQIPLGSLYLSDENVRKIPHSESTIIAIAASIATFGLLSDLLVSESDDGRFAVEAGGGRLAALNLLAERGTITNAYLVGCKIVPAGYAKQFSLAENIAREDMHPADMYVAFRDLAAEGKSVDQIASTFGVSKLTVERRMSLGDLHPELLQMFRKGEISQEQAIALTRAGKPEDQLAVWESLPTYSRSAYHIRNATDEASMAGDAYQLQIIGGLSVYEAAGGAVERDLFADEDDESEGVRVLDKALVLRLVQEKLQAMGEAVQAEGWAWVRTDFAREIAIHTFDRVSEDEEATEQAALADETMQKLRARSDELAQIENAYEEQQEVANEEADFVSAKDADAGLRKVWNEQRELNAQIRDRLNELRVFAASDMATAGCVVRPSSAGYVEIIRGLVERQPLRADKAASVQTIGTVPEIEKEESTDSGEESKRADYSQRLVEDFNAHISAALRNKIAMNPKLALALTCLQMMDVGSSSQMLDFSGSPRRNKWYAERAAGFENSPAAKEWSDIYQSVPDYELTEGHQSYPWPEIKLAWLLTLEQEQLLALFSALVGQSVDATKRDGEEAFLTAICDAANLDMSDYWNAGKQNFCEAVSRKVLMKAMAEAGVTGAPDLERTPKAQAVAVAGAALQTTTWLPLPLRV